MKKHVLVTLADKNFIKQAKQLFSSAYWNGGWNGDYLLLSYKIPQKELNWFQKKGILVYKCKTLIDYRKIKINEQNRNYAHPIYACKFYLFSDFFKKWDNVVFLDADIIVRKSIKELSEINSLRFALDLSPIIKHQFVQKKYLQSDEDIMKLSGLENEYDLKNKALNSGVICFRTDLISSTSFNQLIALFEMYKNIVKFPEQAIFNLYFYKRYKELPLVYNCPSILLKKNENSIILHTMMNQQAWKKNSQFYEEWNNNYVKADYIDIKNTRQAERISIFKIKYFSYILKKRIYNYIKSRNPEKAKKDYLYHYIKKFIGLIGILIKKISPKAYFLLKKNIKNDNQ